MTNWSQRLETLMEEAKRSNSFSHNSLVRKYYYRLLNAVDKKDIKLIKDLIIKMGF